MSPDDELRWLATDADGASHGGWVLRRDVEHMLAWQFGPDAFWGFQEIRVLDSDRTTILASRTRAVA